MKAAALAEISRNRYRFGPLFTPPTLEGAFQRPNAGGSVNWGGAAFDPETGLLYIKSTDAVQINKAGKLDKKTSANPFAAMSDLDYVAALKTFP